MILFAGYNEQIMVNMIFLMIFTYNLANITNKTILFYKAF